MEELHGFFNSRLGLGVLIPAGDMPYPTGQLGQFPFFMFKLMTPDTRQNYRQRLRMVHPKKRRQCVLQSSATPRLSVPLSAQVADHIKVARLS